MPWTVARLDLAVWILVAQWFAQQFSEIVWQVVIEGLGPRTFFFEILGHHFMAIQYGEHEVLNFHTMGWNGVPNFENPSEYWKKSLSSGAKVQTTSETCGKIMPLHFAALQQSEEKTIPAE